jgi:hypothetical protein
VRELANSTGLELVTLRSIFNAIDNLSALKKELGTTDQAIDAATRTVPKDGLLGLDKKRDQITAAVDAYFDDNPIAISLKARRLTHLHPQLFVDAEIITDARPVFDSKAENVLEYVITHSLLVTLHEDVGDFPAQHKHSRLYIAMDFADLLKLRQACDRAIRKGHSLKAELGDKGRILGEDDK